MRQGRLMRSSIGSLVLKVLYNFQISNFKFQISNSNAKGLPNTYLYLAAFWGNIGLLALISLTAALGNFAALLPAFVCGCTVIYLVTSFNFLQKGILLKQPQKPPHFDWIRVNGFVALFLGSLFIFQSIYFRGNDELNETVQTRVEAMAKEMKTGEIPDAKQIIHWVLNFMLISGLCLNAHIWLSFLFLKKFAGLFGKS